LLSGVASEIVLIDANHARAVGEAADISHAAPNSRSARVWAGDYSDCGAADVVVVCAGVAQKPGESRLELLKRNADIFGQVIPRINESGFGGVLLIATNPVDVLTSVARRLSNLPAHRVFGSGTILDTARLRDEIGRFCAVDSHSVHAYLIGEHGDSSVPVWSGATIGGMPLDLFCAAQNLPLDQGAKDAMFHHARDAARDIIAAKGATYYAIGSGLAKIVEAVLRDQNTVLSVSSDPGGIEGISGVCLSLPTIVNREGVRQVLALPLAPEEADGLRRSAEILGSSLASLNPG
jgi:L-lactate dehydrogenase